MICYNRKRRVYEEIIIGPCEVILIYAVWSSGSSLIAWNINICYIVTNFGNIVTISHWLSVLSILIIILYCKYL